MRVLALGGAGGMGRHLCRAAINLDGVSELIVADLDASAAERFADQLGTPARSLGLDVTDHAALREALSEADVVVNTVGPFYRFGVPILAAAIDAGCHYLDICDDWEPTIEMLELSARAEAAGVTAVIGMGATPGLSNLLAVLAARELDGVEEIVTGWNVEAGGLDAAGPGVSAAVVHGIAQMTGTIRVRRDGRFVDERPLRRTMIDYPGLGRRATWTFGHPEPITLPRTISAATSVNVTTGSRPFLAFMRATRWAVDRRLVSAARAARVTQFAERHLPSPPLDKHVRPDRLPPLFALATGTHDGRPAVVAAALCHFPGTTMGAVTGVPLAVALELCTTGVLAAPGVFAPEAIIDPEHYLARLAPHCPTNPAPEEMAVITRSWDPDATTTYRDAIRRALTAVAHHR
ncbi:saccharopine dehydrogenase-like NADP-dependent oxidoreductase [Herbihabitans rhizosphaerae]|uniref:Saccharopine dehydrogenase-like NADP-dependent oxidoreductase n=1 Tax=Herbihabitans rhizosphaerae TaxID=1872711 RepID=A0A4Q7L531_9PSEU|nr:saccharopine dehydrogenase NADP-binding domain-containing protein [Herbihabitans rhizosphaerae]RZS44749.1 saccharopine dehydrogenase-like NADP-dependent oxidoreductase [Herbihabitans rhizosphaerae]